MEHSRFQRMMTDAVGGSPLAASELVDRYGPHLQGVIRRQLAGSLRSRFDSDDFAQMVWASFFRHPPSARKFSNAADLRRFLARTARHKVIDEYRKRLQTDKHDIRREKPCSDLPHFAAHGDTPSQFAIAREQFLSLVRQPSPRNRQLIRLRLQGATPGEIALRLGIHERTVRKLLRQLEDACEDS